MQLKNSAGRSYFWQWDLCQKLIVDDGCTCKEVHFCNGSSETSLVCLIEEADGERFVNVPNILLQEEGMITAYLCARAEDVAETKLSQHFQVLPRAKPDDYVYTETEVLNYQSLVTRIDEIERKGVSEEQIAAAVESYLEENPAGVNFEPDGNTLVLKDGVLSVNTTNSMEQDNTQPITSAGVFATVGNIEVLLKTI